MNSANPITFTVKETTYQGQRLSAEEEFEITSKIESLLFPALTSTIKNQTDAQAKLSLSDIKSILKVIDVDDFKFISNKILDRGLFKKGESEPLDMTYFQGRTGLFRIIISTYCYEAFSDFFSGLQEDLQEILAEKS